MAEREPPGDGNVTAWRLQELEKKVDEAVRVMQQGTVAVGAQITAVSNQIGNAMASMPEHYAPRREAEERHAAIEARFSDQDRRWTEFHDGLEQRFVLRDKALDEREARITSRIDELRGLVRRIEMAGWGLGVAILLTFVKDYVGALRPG